MAKTNFLNTMSHQIRTPLNAIIGMSTLLRSGSSPSQQNENLKLLDFSAENLMATVNNIIDFNDLDNAKIELDQNLSLPTTQSTVFSPYSGNRPKQRS